VRPTPPPPIDGDEPLAQPYTLIHSNVDGAGIIGTFETLKAAMAEADRRQAKVDARDGNPWCYTYSVFAYLDRCVYRTRMAPRR
jgi:hypothetical protein